jgi:hypothetical protein
MRRAILSMAVAMVLGACSSAALQVDDDGGARTRRDRGKKDASIEGDEDDAGRDAGAVTDARVDAPRDARPDVIGNGPCAVACATSLCASPASDPAPGDACDECLDSAGADEACGRLSKGTPNACLECCINNHQAGTQVFNGAFITCYCR